MLVPTLLGVFSTYRAVRTTISTFDGMVQLQAPGPREVSLPSGDLTIFAERSMAVSCSVTDASGASLEVHAPGSHSEFTIGSRHGESVLAFTSPRAGTYQVSCDTASPVTLYIGRDLFAPIVRVVLAVGASIVMIPLTALGVWWWRRRPRRAVVA